MTTHYYLTTPKAERSAIRLSVTHHNKQYNKCIGISVSPKDWLKDKEKSRDVQVNSRLNTIRAFILGELDDQSHETDILRALERIKGGRIVDVSEKSLIDLVCPSFCDYFKSWSERECSSTKQHTLAYRKVVGVMGTNCDWKDLDDGFYFRLVQGLREQGCSTNYIGNIVSRMKTAVAEAYKLHYHNNDAFKGWSRLHEDAFAVALSPAEMELLWELPSEGLSAMERHARDLAWIGYLTAARFSDYSRLTADNIVDGKICFVQEKTDSEVLIPCAPRVMEILRRYGGRAPKICEQNFNENIKSVCRKAGIVSVVQVPESKRKMMGWGKREIIEKWRLVSSHTFRRSGATALYKSGVPISLCCKVTGHKKSEQFLKYCKISNTDAAEELAKFEFFK